MKNTVKRTLALILCMVLFASVLGTSAFAINSKADQFYAWYNKAKQDYSDDLIKHPITYQDYQINSLIKYLFAVDVNVHKSDAMIGVAKEALVIDEATYWMLVAEQKLKEQEAIDLAIREKAARDQAVLETEQARADAWAAAQTGVPADVAYDQYQKDGAQAVKDAENEIADAKSDYDAVAKIVEDESEELRRERERRLKELEEQMARIAAAQGTLG